MWDWLKVHKLTYESYNRLRQEHQRTQCSPTQWDEWELERVEVCATADLTPTLRSEPISDNSLQHYLLYSTKKDFILGKETLLIMKAEKIVAI